ncbi:type IV pilus assembly protein PilV [Alteromonadaceae bacterium 2753L.S.0a.02]|nr:type IV pilus assembly protein PilV [Alteromonadaceae bacterium 2753L.S.0a.02]
METILPSNSRGSQRGSAMMETVVSLFILAVGLLGTLAMQARGVNSNQRANFVTEANILAADMVDRILAYNNIDTVSDDGDFDGIVTSANAPDQPDCSAGCSSVEQVAYDTAQWSAMLTDHLPAGSGTVSFEDGMYTIEVMWDAGVPSPGCESWNAIPAENSIVCYTYELRL